MSPEPRSDDSMNFLQLDSLGLFYIRNNENR